MTFPTFIIGILPTYQEIGFWAPLLLTLCRLLQGLCTGGEYNNAAIFILENTPPHKQGFYSGVMTASSIVGFFLASLTTSLCFYAFSPGSSWSWRLPFLLGSLIGLVGFHLRRQLQESKTPHPTSSQKREWLTHKKAFLLTICVGWLAGVLSLSLIGFIPSHLSQMTCLSSSEIFFISNWGLLVYMITLLFMGTLADAVGYSRLMKSAAFSTAIFSYVFFYLINLKVFWGVVLGVSGLGLLAGTFLAPMHAYMLQLFPSHLRCRGTSIGFSLGVSLLGGTSPLALTFLIQAFQTFEAAAFYFSFSGAIVFIMLLIPLSKDSFKVSSPQPPHFPSRPV
jgi:MHS family proline/betaine transporter-like MFS transporter